LIPFHRHFFILVIVLVAFISGLGAAAADWQVSAAPWRLEAVPALADRHDLFVPVPAELGNATPAAFQDNGQPLPCSPVLVGDRLTGVEVEIPAGMARRSCFVYLTPATAAANPPAARARLPVIRQSWDAGMTTRPISLPEICRLVAVLPTVEGANIEPLPGIPGDLDKGTTVVKVEWPNVHNVHNKALTRIVHLYAQIKQEKTGPLVFTMANSKRVPFCLFVDGQPLLLWAPESQGSQISSPAVTVAAGLHRFDFYVMVQPLAQPREVCPIPQLTTGTPNWVSPLLPLRFALQRRDGLEAVQVTFEGARLLWGRDDLAPVLFLPAGLKVPADLSCPLADTHVFAGMRLPAFSVTDKRAGGGTFSFAAMQPEARVLAKWPEFTLLALPVAISARQDIRLTLNLTLSRNLREMQKLLSLRHIYKNGAGKVLETGVRPLPAETTVPWTFTVTPPPEKAATVELQLMAGEQPLMAPMPIHLVAPEAPLERLTAMGDRLLFDGQPALLRCRPITPGRHPRLSGKRLAWFDEVWFTCQAPGADVRPETLPLPRGIHNIHLDTPPPTGTGEMAYELARHASIAKMAAADIVVWSLQRPAGSVYETQRPFLAECLFLAQACQAHGCGVIFVTPPPLPGSDPEAERLAALWMKELGMRAGFTVVDLYSRSQLDHASAGPLADPFAGGPAGTILASPGNAARAWAIQNVFEILNP
jgi:hypothetical protein